MNQHLMPLNHGGCLISMDSIITNKWHSTMRWLDSAIAQSLMLLICSLNAFANTTEPMLWEQDFFTSGSIKSNECRNIYGSGSANSNANAAAVFTCAIMVCGHHRYMDRAECSWFKEVSHSNDFTTDFQDIKNFLALMDLNKAKAAASNMAKQVPFLPKQIYSGLKAGVMDGYVTDLLDKGDPYFLERGLLGSKLIASNYYFVTSHLNGYCSEMEDAASFCPRSLGTTPDDLLASKLTLSPTIYNRNEQAALRQYAINAVNPVPIPLDEPSNIFDSTEAVAKGIYPLKDEGAAYLKEKYLVQMIVSINQEVLRKMYASRLPSQVSPGDKVPEGITRADMHASSLGIVASEATRRFEDPRWYEEMSRLNYSGLLREITSMQALQSFLDFEIDRHAEGLLALQSQEMLFIYRELNAGAAASDEDDGGLQQQIQDIGDVMGGFLR